MRKLSDLIAKGELHGTVQEIDFPNVAAQIEQAKGYDIVLIGGGDGTFSTVLDKLAALNFKVGILPLGTGNDLARELGVLRLFSLKNLSRIIAFYSCAATKEFQTWKVKFGTSLDQERSFVNYLSFGFDADVVTRFAKLRSAPRYLLHNLGRWGNRLGFLIVGFRSFLLRERASPCKLTKDGAAQDNSANSPLYSLMFANIRSVMGMGHSNRSGSPFDAEIECLSVRRFFDFLPYLTGKFINDWRPKELGTSGSWLVEFSTPPPVQIDGEGCAEIVSTRFEISAGRRVQLLVGSSPA